ncbi:MAG: hypothetical protein M3N43_14720 [Actinomycetota bacterium]|nr:hypothetical protein [Actinomycetota bacterium]
MAESLYRGIQLGKEVTFGTEVDATTIFPTDEGSGEFTLDRAVEIPTEDFGTQVAHLGGRASTGVRIATGSLSAQARFEDLGQTLRTMYAAPVYAGVGPYSQTYTAGTTSSTYESLTYEVNNDVQDFIATGVVCTSHDLGFDEIGPGENTMWTVSADLQAANLIKGTATVGPAIPTVLETIEGHLTTIKQGTTATAFASLAELAAHLVSYRIRGEQEKPLRPYGSATDVASAIGLRKRTCTVTAMLKFSATTVSDIWDIFTVAGSLPTERRWRIAATGSGTKSLTIDHRLLFTDIHLEPDGRDGEYLVSVDALATYDSTLATDVVFAIAGVANATLP